MEESLALSHPLAAATPATALRRKSPVPKSGLRAVKAPSDGKQKHPVVVVVGGGTAQRSVRKSLSRLHLQVVVAADAAEAKDMIGSHCRAVISVTPGAPEHIAPLAESCRSSGLAREVPLFVVVGDDFSDRLARSLYDIGATAVFEWPHDLLLLPAMLVEMFGCRPIAGNRKVDAALTRAIETRLSVGDLALGKKVKVRVAAGAVDLGGEVPSYWMKERIVATLMHVPGVTAVLSEDLRVNAANRPDADLARDAQAAVEAVTDNHRGTVSVSASDGCVTLAGVVPSHDELERLAFIVGNVRGLRGIDNLLTISRRAAKSASVRAAALRKDLAKSWPRADLRVSVFGGVAVLSGSVPTLATKRAVASFAASVPSIERVVNKTTVAVE